MMNMGYIMMLVVGWHEYVGGGGSVQGGFHIKLVNEYKSTISPTFFHDIISYHIISLWSTEHPPVYSKYSPLYS